jgi:predicted nucleic acid-binding protein
MIVLDTNVVSELIDENMADAVARWIKQYRASDLCTTVITEAELFYGAVRLPDGKRKLALQTTLERIFRLRFRDRVLSFDSAAARNFGDVVVSRQRNGRTYAYADAQIAAIARSRGAAVATRNVADFEHCGIEVINPWTV